MVVGVVVAVVVAVVVDGARVVGVVADVELGVFVVVVACGAVVGGAGVEAPTGRQMERPGTSTVSTDASFTSSRSESDTPAASAIRIQ